MKTYFYSCEINLHHPDAGTLNTAVAAVTTDDVQIASFISRDFLTESSMYMSLEDDIVKKLKKVKAKDAMVRVNETNPYRLAPPELLEARGLEDEEFKEYLETWEEDTLCRVTCTTEDIDTDDDGELFAPPEEFLIRYHVREFDDGLELPPDSFVPQNISSMVQ